MIVNLRTFCRTCLLMMGSPFLNTVFIKQLQKLLVNIKTNNNEAFQSACNKTAWMKKEHLS